MRNYKNSVYYLLKFNDPKKKKKIYIGVTTSQNLRKHFNSLRTNYDKYEQHKMGQIRNYFEYFKHGCELVEIKTLKLKNISEMKEEYFKLIKEYEKKFDVSKAFPEKRTYKYIPKKKKLIVTLKGGGETTEQKKKIVVIPNKSISTESETINIRPKNRIFNCLICTVCDKSILKNKKNLISYSNVKHFNSSFHKKNAYKFRKKINLFIKSLGERQNNKLKNKMSEHISSVFKGGQTKKSIKKQKKRMIVGDNNISISKDDVPSEIYNMLDTDKTNEISNTSNKYSSSNNKYDISEDSNSISEDSSEKLESEIEESAVLNIREKKREKRRKNKKKKIKLGSKYFSVSKSDVPTEVYENL